MLLPIKYDMSRNIQFSHTMALWYQSQFDEQTIIDWSSIFIFILILGLIFEYNLRTSPTLVLTAFTTYTFVFCLKKN